MTILIDQDGVLADFEHGFYAVWRKLHPEKFHLPLEERKTFYIPDEYPEELRKDVEEIYRTKGFFRDLPLIPGAVEAVNVIKEKGHHVFICTSPMFSNPTCMRDKVIWVQKHFSNDMARRMIITKDKTPVHADLLIDDRPEVRGAVPPKWEHVLFDRPYNRDIMNKRRITWENWKDVLTEL